MKKIGIGKIILLLFEGFLAFMSSGLIYSWEFLPRIASLIIWGVFWTVVIGAFVYMLIKRGEKTGQTLFNFLWIFLLVPTVIAFVIIVYLIVEMFLYFG